VLIGDAVGVFGLAQRAYLILCSLWLLLAAVTVLRRAPDFEHIIY
jgi:hypothetical protein